MGLGQAFKYYAYHSDGGFDGLVRLSTDDAAAGGFGSPVKPGTLPPWGYGRARMRHVEGVDAGGRKTTLPLASNSDSLYVSGGSFTLQGRTYDVVGQIGETRSPKYL